MRLKFGLQEMGGINEAVLVLKALMNEAFITEGMMLIRVCSNDLNTVLPFIMSSPDSNP